MSHNNNQSNRYFSLKGFKIPLDIGESIIPHLTKEELGIIFTSIIEYHRNKGLETVFDDKALTFIYKMFVREFKKDEQDVNNNRGNWWHNLRDPNKIADNIKARKIPEYRKWRSGVFNRDNYKCQYCKSSTELHAHHIKPFAIYPELRFEILNGITLCKKCHIEEHRKHECK